MIPRMGWRNRLRLALAILRGRVWVQNSEMTGWGQRITLRTVEHIELIQGGQ